MRILKRGTMRGMDATAVESPSHVERGLRGLLLLTLVLGMAGVSADLLLLDHVEEATQVIPFAVLAFVLVALIAHAMARRAITVQILQAGVLGFIACGALGAYYHFVGNAEFQREIEPDIGGASLVWKVLRAKAPPALAPMAFVQLGLVGLAWTYRHPLLRARG